MLTHAIEYLVVRQHGGGWAVLRGHAPIGRRYALADALDFATQLAECEAAQGRHATRVLMDQRDLGELPGGGQWRRAA
ncbi:hypothetical protein [Dyella japonica]|uniref:DUF2188 domain-containing protein n=1 Tax=Dyella japonica A8 TaxID=1217721 RepID=A0A075JXD8_9GAMM|nr:hypothetical protein [Dyella japonica]AIF46776.1 hypothetical protein HY57_05620 [Dyella japonica A8]